MAISDYLNNIPAGDWQRGTMKTIDFYLDTVLSTLDNPNYSSGKFPHTTDVRFRSWYSGTCAYEAGRGTKGWYTTNVNSADSINKLPERYRLAAINTLHRYGGGLENQDGVGNSNYFNTKADDLTNKRLVVYIEYVPFSQFVSENKKYKAFAKSYKYFGDYISGVRNETPNPDPFTYTPNSLFNYLIGISGYDNTTGKGTLSAIDVDDLSDYYVVKTLNYYSVDTGGNRVKLGSQPTFPFLFSGVNLNVYTSSSAVPFASSKRVLADVSGLTEIKLPLPSNASYASLWKTIGSYPLHFSAGGISVNGNVVDAFFREGGETNPFLPYLGDYKAISYGTYTKQNGIVDINSTEITCPFEMEYIFCSLYDVTYEHPIGRVFRENGQLMGQTDNTHGVLQHVFTDFENLKSIFADWGIYASDNIDEILYGEIPNIIPENPAGGESGIDPTLPNGGGVGDNVIPDPEKIPQDDKNIIDDFPVNPPILTQANLCDSYIYNYSQVRQLFKWFCSKGYIENQSELFADKLSAIYGLMMYPFDFVNHDGGHVTPTDTTTIVSVSENISGYILEYGYNTIINGGEITYFSYYGNYADWELCAYSIYIPYCGVTELPPSAVVNRRLTVQYAVDLLTGKATCIVKSYAIDSDLGVLVKLIPCQIGNIVPIQSSNYAQREVSNTLSAISMATSAINGTASIINSARQHDKAGAVLNGIRMGTQLIEQGANLAFNQRLTYCATGNASPSTGIALPQTPFLSISRKHLVKPTNYRNQNGIPTAYYATLSSLSTGNNFVQCENVYLDSIRATSVEINEIRSLLSNGIYI